MEQVARGAGLTMERPNGSGWMTLHKWAEFTETPLRKALEYANPNSKRTAKTFHIADVDRRSSHDIKVWYQAPNPITGFRRPRLVPRKSVHEVGLGAQLEV